MEVASPEVVIRQAKAQDLEQLLVLAQAAGPGMTNFPPDAKLLAEKIAWSEASLAKDVTEPGQEYYYFVMESVAEQRVVGCCGIFARAGGEMPFYSYKIAKELLVSQSLGINKEIQKLYLLHDHNDTSEVATLYLDPQYRANRNGELLSRSRFLFMRAFKQRFAKKVIAEMRGVVDSAGRSPFWDSLGSKFFDLSFMQADRLCSIGQKQFIGDLMPHHTIYVSLLSEQAQETIGKVHASTVPALRLLKKEGFHFEGYIDIFDAGPTMEARVANLYSVKKSRHAKIVAIRDSLDVLPVSSTVLEPRRYMVSNCQLQDFRVVTTELEIQADSNPSDEDALLDDRVVINQATAEALKVREGDRVLYIAFPLVK